MPCHRGRTMLCLAAIAFVSELLTGGTKAQCPDTKCGGVDIPYPFSIGPGSCAMAGFELDCIDSRPFLGDFEVLNISLHLSELRVLNKISSFCYNPASKLMEQNTFESNLDTPFMLSDTSNKFTIIGCQTLAYITDQDYVGKYMSGCVSVCRRGDVTSATNGACSGIGCCQTAIPKGLGYYQVFFDTGLNTSNSIYNATPCSYAVLVDSSNFNFSTNYLTSVEFNTTYGGRAPMVLDWAIRTANNCEEAKNNHTLSYACKSDNSECINSSNGPGYICNCKNGYQGNPYRQDGCQDIDECKEPNKCYGKCRNKDGGFDCTCPFGTRGNAHTGPCDRGLVIGICASLLVTLTILLGIEWFKYKQRITRHELMRQREEYFRLRGGQLLTNMMSRDNNIRFMLYDRDQIELATNSFDNTLVIGQGGQGTVYRGRINDDSNSNLVAIKKCKGFDEDSWAEFTDEMLILSRVNHENIVKLLGCCLQFDVPILVYEFVPNKTLYNLIHIQTDPSIRTLEIRLKVAAESAEALAYLHSSLDHPIILHGDVKSTNILLSNNFIAKVSDFGCSKIRTADENYDMVKGTMGYLDPEYLRNFQLTDKSDVYSFGVVLLELLTRRTPLSVDKVSLASIFQEAMREGHFLELIDTEILHEDNMGLISDLATLASQCLIMTSESRPTMSTVAEELRRSMAGQVQQDQGVLTGISSLALTSSAANTSEHFTGEPSTGYYSLKGVAPMSIEFAR